MLMFEYVTNTTWDAVAERIEAAERIALVTHTRPDGDALGSLLGLHRALASRGQRSDVLVMGEIDPGVLALADTTPLLTMTGGPAPDPYDLIVIIDTGAWGQLEPLQDWLRTRRDDIIGIDHHPRGDDVAAARIVDTSAAAAAEMVLTLLDVLGCPLTDGVHGIVEPLFAGMATDTGWFRFQSAGPSTLRAAARLLEAGVDKARLFRTLEESYGPGRLALTARALNSVEYLSEGRIAIQSIDGADFEAAGATTSDLTGLVNEPMCVAGVLVAIMLVEMSSDLTKLSFRAKPGREDRPAIDVNVLAQRFGGGGHPFAAGARLEMDLPSAKKVLYAALDGIFDG
jgi:phosphoesterase RecJ-like protein